MNIHRWFPSCLLALTGLSAFGLPARAASPTATDGFAPNYARIPGVKLLHWAHFPVRVFITPSPVATDARKKSLLAGFDQWVQATDGVVQYRLVSARSQADIAVTFQAGATVSSDPGAAGSTGVAFSGPVLKKADMELATGGFDSGSLQSVTAHEFGHALGIDGHSDAPDDLMYPTATRFLTFDLVPVPSAPRGITLRDLNTLKACYPALFTAARRPSH